MSEPCQCDPIGSGEEHCNGGCVRRQHAAIRGAIVSANDAWQSLEKATGWRADHARLLLRRLLWVLTNEDRELCAERPTPSFLQPLVVASARDEP